VGPVAELEEDLQGGEKGGHEPPVDRGIELKQQRSHKEAQALAEVRGNLGADVRSREVWGRIELHGKETSRAVVKLANSFYPPGGLFSRHPQTPG
jgi:hypothetical protein